MYFRNLTGACVGNVLFGERLEVGKISKHAAVPSRIVVAYPGQWQRESKRWRVDAGML